MKRKSSTKQSGYDTDEEKSKVRRSVAASSKRAPKRAKHERIHQLEEDEWAMQVEAKQILCRGCNEWKRLGKDYDIKDWDTHKSKCSGITGTQNKRIFHGPEKFATAVSVYLERQILLASPYILSIPASWHGASYILFQTQTA